MMANPPPFYRTHIFCCTNRREEGSKRGCCASKGSESLRDYMKKQVARLGLPATRVNAAGCLDRCELGPCIVIYPEGVWYAPKNEADVDDIIATHLQQGKRVERLMLPGRGAQAE